MTNSIRLIDRFKAIFAKDKHAYWFSHFTDEEKKLRCMDAWELAKTINEAEVCRNTERKIIAEYLLNVRLAKLQARPVWWSIIAGLIGIAGGALLTRSLQDSENQVKCVCECKQGEADNKNVTAPVPKSVSPIIDGVVPPAQGDKNARQPNPEQKP